MISAICEAIPGDSGAQKAAFVGCTLSVACAALGLIAGFHGSSFSWSRNVSLGMAIGGGVGAIALDRLFYKLTKINPDDPSISIVEDGPFRVFSNAILRLFSRS